VVNSTLAGLSAVLPFAAQSQLGQEVEDDPEKDAQPEIQEQAPIEGKDLVMKNVGQAVFEKVVNRIAPNDRDEDFCEFADRDFHGRRLPKPRSSEKSVWPIPFEPEARFSFMKPARPMEFQTAYVIIRPQRLTRTGVPFEWKAAV
jgi:hypothetical protein